MKKFFKKLLQTWKSKEYWKKHWKRSFFRLLFVLVTVPLVFFVFLPCLEYIIEKWGLKISKNSLPEISFLVVVLLIFLVAVAIRYLIKRKKPEKNKKSTNQVKSTIPKKSQQP